MLQAMEEQMQRANHLKIESAKERERHELDIKQLRQTIKVTGTEKGDDEMKDFAEQMGLGKRKGWETVTSLYSVYDAYTHRIRGSTAHKGRPI